MSPHRACLVGVLVVLVALPALAPAARAEYGYCPIWNVQSSYVPPLPPPRYVTITTYYPTPVSTASSWNSPSWTSGSSWSSSPSPNGASDAPEVVRPAESDLELYTRSCRAESAWACLEAARAYLSGTRGFPKDRAKAMEAATRACDGGEGEGCRLLGVAAEESTPPDVDAAERHYRRACVASMPSEVSCGAVGILSLRRGVPVPEVERLLERGCNGGNGLACRALGYAVVDGRAAGGRPRERRLFELGCVAGDQEACSSFAWYLLSDPTVRDLVRARDLLTTACDGGNAYGCELLGGELLTGERFTPDRGAAAARLEKACAGGRTVACETIATEIDAGGRLPEDLARSARLRRERCDAKSYSACGDLALMLLAGRGVLADPAEARRLLELACDHDDGWSCGQLAALDDGKDKARRARALTLLEKGCALSDAGTCASLARALFDAKDTAGHARVLALATASCNGGSRGGCGLEAWLRRNAFGAAYDPDGAFAAGKRACDGGDVESCAAVGWSLAVGVGTRADRAAGAKLLEATCQRGQALACVMLGELIGERAGDASAAFALFERACAAGEASGCAARARARVLGAGTPQDVKAGRRELEALCRERVEAGCVALATTLVHPPAGQRADGARAAKLFERACAAGSAPACGELGALRLAGIGGKADDVAAITLLERACDRGHASACAGVADIYAQGSRTYPADAITAAIWLRRACAAGWRAACSEERP